MSVCVDVAAGSSESLFFSCFNKKGNWELILKASVCLCYLLPITRLKLRRSSLIWAVFFFSIAVTTRFPPLPPLINNESMELCFCCPVYSITGCSYHAVFTWCYFINILLLELYGSTRIRAQKGCNIKDKSSCKHEC